MKSKQIKIGDRVKYNSPWGYIEGVVTKIYPKFRDDEGWVRPETLAMTVTSSLPKNWPYSTPEIAPETSEVTQIKNA